MLIKFIIFVITLFTSLSSFIAASPIESFLNIFSGTYNIEYENINEYEYDNFNIQGKYQIEDVEIVIRQISQREYQSKNNINVFKNNNSYYEIDLSITFEEHEKIKMDLYNVNTSYWFYKFVGVYNFDGKEYAFIGSFEKVESSIDLYLRGYNNDSIFTENITGEGERTYYSISMDKSISLILEKE